MKIGIALVPNEETVNKVVTIQNKWYDEFEFIDKLNTDSAIPHITLYEGDLKDGIEYKRAVRKTAKQIRDTLTNLQIKMLDVTYVNKGWYFWRCELSKELYDAHMFTIRQIYPFISAESRIVTSKISSADERSAVKKYGYRYAGKTFIPHITIGRTDYDNKQRVIDILNNELPCQIIQVKKVIAYILEDNGTCGELIAETSLI